MMQPLFINQTEFSPLVNFSPESSYFEIRGESRPENTAKFYAVLLQWMQEYQRFLKDNPKQQKLIFEFKFDYFNSTSAKFILDFLRQLEQLQIDNTALKLVIHWHYDKLDEDMRDSGEEFSHLVKVPFEFIAH